MVTIEIPAWATLYILPSHSAYCWSPTLLIIEGVHYWVSEVGVLVLPQVDELVQYALLDHEYYASGDDVLYIFSTSAHRSPMSLGARLQSKSAEYQKLQGDLAVLVDKRTRLDTQLSENEMVKKVSTCLSGSPGPRQHSPM